MSLVTAADNPTASARAPRAGRAAGSSALGAAVRAARTDARLTLKELGARVGSSPTSLHGLEAGSRSADIELLQRIADATGADAEALLREAGTAPGHLTAELLSQELSGALAHGSLRREARVALRRIHLEARAMAYVPFAPAATQRIDIEDVLFKKLEVDFKPDPESDGHARFAGEDIIYYHPGLDHEGQQLARRVMLAHMGGHVILARDAGRAPHCHARAGGSTEAEATWLGGCLLLPRSMLVSTFRLIEGKYDVDEPAQFGALLAELARRSDVPVWLVARHVADAEVLLSAAGLDDL